MMRGLLIAFEGLDQSGKQTQAERLRDRVVETGRLVTTSVLSRLRHRHRNRDRPRAAGRPGLRS